jgi:hypothetical protein
MSSSTAWRSSEPAPCLSLAPRLEELEANGAADDELIVRVAPAHRLVDDPLRAVHEAQVLAQVLAEIGEALEWDAVPETAATFAPEQSLAHDLRDGAVRREIVGQLEAVRPDNAEPLKTSPFAPLYARQDS